MHHIFAVEDNPGDVRLLEEAFTACDFDVRLEVSPDGKDGLGRLRELAHASNLPDLIVLNVNLPKLPGDRVLGLLKADPAFAEVPIVMLTSSDDPLDRERCQAADDYLVKSGSWEELVEVARRIGTRLTGM